MLTGEVTKILSLHESLGTYKQDSYSLFTEAVPNSVKSVEYLRHCKKKKTLKIGHNIKRPYESNSFLTPSPVTTVNLVALYKHSDLTH